MTPSFDAHARKIPIFQKEFEEGEISDTRIGRVRLHIELSHVQKSIYLP